MPPLDDHQLAANAASSAGEMLEELRQDWFSGRRRRSSTWVEYEGDEAGHTFLMEMLTRERPADRILSEEGRDSRDHTGEERLWIVDPVDGSSDYGRGAGDWAVHVALTENGAGIAGAVSMPAAGLIFSTALPPTVPEQKAERPVLVTGRSRAHYEGRALAAALDADLATCGSAGVKAMLVVMGEVDLYVHGGPLYEWDVCAPAIVAEAAGLHVSGADGSTLVFGQRRPVVPGFVVSRPEYAEAALAALRSQR